MSDTHNLTQNRSQPRTLVNQSVLVDAMNSVLAPDETLPEVQIDQVNVSALPLVNAGERAAQISMIEIEGEANVE